MTRPLRNTQKSMHSKLSATQKETVTMLIYIPSSIRQSSHLISTHLIIISNHLHGRQVSLIGLLER